MENIISGGFNRSYAGKNATFYGPGCYIARDSSYSARNTYSPPDAQVWACNQSPCISLHLCVSHPPLACLRPCLSRAPSQGIKHIFLCRIALGAHCKVDYGYTGKEPPVRDDTRCVAHARACAPQL